MTLIDFMKEHTADYLEMFGNLDTKFEAPVIEWDTDGSISSITFSSSELVYADWQPFVREKTNDIKRKESGEIIEADYMIITQIDVSVEEGYRASRNGDADYYNVTKIQRWPDHLEIYVKAIKEGGDA